jgi:hypothetical protein
VDQPRAFAVARQAQDDVQRMHPAAAAARQQVGAGVADRPEARPRGAPGLGVLEVAAWQPGPQVERAVAGAEEEGDEQAAQGQDQRPAALLEGEQGEVAALGRAEADGAVEGVV